MTSRSSDRFATIGIESDLSIARRADLQEDFLAGDRLHVLIDPAFGEIDQRRFA